MTRVKGGPALKKSLESSPPPVAMRMGRFGLKVQLEERPRPC